MKPFKAELSGQHSPIQVLEQNSIFVNWMTEWIKFIAP